MKFSKWLINFVILLTIPAMVAYPQADVPQIYVPSGELTSYIVEN